ncbi:hypothetical protein [uncultured Parasutterella sp.]|uniref:hypothetical protein n=2 Tax=uncultured Parasutterella sp. TaxID=1263098 RepID=UPI00259293B8|nr:hypothetical protein [uncultured Parasutterella sp.]
MAARKDGPFLTKGIQMKSSLSIAERFVLSLDHAASEPCGAIIKTKRNWERFESQCVEKRYIRADDRGAIDPSVVWRFKDNSMVFIDNPNQRCFRMIVRVVTLNDLNPETWDWK